MKKNEIVLSKEEIAAGVEKINHALLQVGLRCNEGDVGYETVYTDDHGETQGGWYAEFDTKSREKLRNSKQVSWRNVGMISGDTLDSILKTIANLKFRNCVKEPTPLQVRRAEHKQNKVESTKRALEIFNSAQPLSDGDLHICIEHFRTLEEMIKADPMLKLALPYVVNNLYQLENYLHARKSK